MIEIDNLYDKVNKDVTTSFEKFHEKLIKEEEEIKDKLQNNVIKVKEEHSLSESNRLIKISEKVKKGIKSLEKEEKNMIRTLTYISKINKSKKEI